MGLITIGDGQIQASPQMAKHESEKHKGTALIVGELYSNHLGAVDNFTQTGVVGTGTATADATNHEMDLSTALTNLNRAYFETKKAWALQSSPTIATFILQNIVNGVGGDDRNTWVGLADDFTNIQNGCFIRQNLDGTWRVYTLKATGNFSSTNITALTGGEVISIVATTAKVEYYVDGVLKVKHTNTTNIPTAALKIGCMVVLDGLGAGTARSVSVDYMGIVRTV